MPPRRPAPRKKRHSTSAPTPVEKPEQKQTSFIIGGGNAEIRSLWMMLNRHEKFHILDVTVEEIVNSLFRMIIVPDETRDKIEALINDPAYSTNIRILFLSALDSPNLSIHIPSDFPSPSLAFLDVLDKHLRETYDRYNCSALLWLMSFFFLFFNVHFGFWLKSVMLALCGGFLGLFSGRKLWLIPETVFDQVFSNSSQRVQVLVTNAMLFSLNYWSPHSTLIKWVSIVPYLLLILKEFVSAEDVGFLDLSQRILLMIMKAFLLYFAWYSWIWTAFVLATMLTPLFTVLVHVGALCCQACIAFLDFLIPHWTFLHRLTNSLVDFAIFPVFLFYALYFQSSWSWALTVLLMPALARSGLLTLFNIVIPGLMSKSSPITLFICLQLGLTLIAVLSYNFIVQSFLRIQARFPKSQSA